MPALNYKYVIASILSSLLANYLYIATLRMYIIIHFMQYVSSDMSGALGGGVPTIDRKGDIYYTVMLMPCYSLRFLLYTLYPIA
jgi:hypothetical protein